jgi:hypothetical protein
MRRMFFRMKEPHAVGLATLLLLACASAATHPPVEEECRPREPCAHALSISGGSAPGGGRTIALAPGGTGGATQAGAIGTTGAGNGVVPGGEGGTNGAVGIAGSQPGMDRTTGGGTGTGNAFIGGSGRPDVAAPVRSGAAGQGASRPLEVLVVGP